jgi:hypothetical protein
MAPWYGHSPLVWRAVIDMQQLLTKPSEYIREPSNALWSAAKEGQNEVISYLLDCGVVPASPSPIIAYARLPRGKTQLSTLVRLIDGTDISLELAIASEACVSSPKRSCCVWLL